MVCPPRRARWNAPPDLPAHAQARLRLRAGERRPRHQGAAGLARSSQYPAHGARHTELAPDRFKDFLARLAPAFFHPGPRGTGAGRLAVNVPINASVPSDRVYLWQVKLHNEKHVSGAETEHNKQATTSNALIYCQCWCSVNPEATRVVIESIEKSIASAGVSSAPSKR